MNKSIEQLKNYLQHNNIHQVLVLTDANVDELYPHYLDPLQSIAQVDKLVIPADESSKSLEQATEICHYMLNKGYDKHLCMVNFGGGMVCDLGGFVAATYKRGVHCVNYPTTLLAMIDAAHGGKTAVNMDGIKNCVGLIRQPDLVVESDLDLLKTLPHQELLSGFGELIKYALISSKDLFHQLQTMMSLSAEAIRPEWIAHCINFKNKVVAIDPEDKKERHILNFGHTFGHAFESLYAAEGHPIPHGVAVAYGMAYELPWASTLQGEDFEEEFEVLNLIGRFYDIPDLTSNMFKTLEKYMRQDKKNKGGNEGEKGSTVSYALEHLRTFKLFDGFSYK
ncbi:MAG: 3-dehydroquinate synthase [Bacteroidales bacterium]|nr:3-dehydroquinate synthase [Bacteroidales bacterium]